MDTVDRRTRSRIMASVRQRHTGPEILLRSTLHRAGLRYLLHNTKLPGSPDLVFPRYRAVIFVHGCYWHAHGCYRSTIPKSRREFWHKKFENNRKRDERNITLLHWENWRVMVVWECVLVGKLAFPSGEVPTHILAWLKGTDSYGELPGYSLDEIE